MSDTKWIEEEFNSDYHLRYAIEDVLFSETTPFQKVEVVQTKFFGKMLLNDGLVMVTERDEFIYHDMIVHVPLFTHPNPKRVLIIGGGDGGTAREVLRHKNVDYCRMVEIDDAVVRSCQEFIPQTASCLTNDSRLTLTIDDGVKFVAQTDETFDVILIDSTDPIGPGAPLFGDEFYKNVDRILASDGIVVSQGETPYYAKEMQATLLKILKNKFPVVQIYNYSNLTYPGGVWSFTFGSKKYHPLTHFDPKRIGASGLKFSYYNEGIHKAAFALPTFMQEQLSEYLSA